ncbi:histidine phosphatase family protein [Corallincola luteus]|uniref:Histidine phosphatase family protein n=1 Tax=Corallincola luteus TaxID=1775177 RepID=A0ABY2APW0_9GAMM|nr:histidine phosphatase family protein [Corallincola luteus]TCI04944.1 histidine phosphatase family protein [Corallincola luteus]
MATTDIYLVRHGETTWNQTQRLQGHLDSPLTQRGKQQAKQAAELLQTTCLAAVYSSDLARCSHTAQCIAAQHKLPLTTLSGLRERHFGPLQGMQLTDMDHHQLALCNLHVDGSPDAAPLGGESVREVWQRSQNTLAEIVKPHVNQAIVVVTHGSVLAILLQGLAAKPLHPVRTGYYENGAVVGLQWQH